jgi:hypothetical protein
VQWSDFHDASKRTISLIDIRILHA